MFFFFFEQEAIDIINQSLTGEETLEVGVISRDYGYDYLLPKGCRQLGFPPRTAIEIKKKLVPGLLSILLTDAYKAYEKREFNLFVVLYEEGHVYQQWIHEEIKNFVLFLTKNQLKDRFSVLNIEHKSIDWKEDRNLRVAKLRKEFHEVQISLFVGAGLSSSLGVPGWGKLLKQLTKRVQKDVMGYPNYQAIKNDSDKSFLITARYLNNAAERNELPFIAGIRKKLYKTSRLKSDFMDAVIELLKQNRIGEIITYNYDTLLEQRMTSEEISNASIDCQNKRVRNEIPVMHVHGVIHPVDTDYDKNVVLSEDEYHKLYRDSYHWANVAQLYALTHTKCIFVGLSMTDPSLRRLLDIAFQQGSGDVDHYAFLIRTEFDCHKETEEVFSQMGVNIIWCEDRDDVPRQIMRVV